MCYQFKMLVKILKGNVSEMKSYATESCTIIETTCETFSIYALNDE